ncbi:MAG: DNA replication/repair protein RecF [Clostridia bacterium]|nr:DNA replication/repair protein RecF [Clostridia bacterium]
MYINKICIDKFRNYEKLDLDFSKNINIIFGNNGKGKTNILEAIYICAITKSYRTSKDNECIKFGDDYCNIDCEFEDKNIKTNIQVYIDNNGKKQIKENGIKITKYTDYIGKFPVVMFSPDDMDIVKGSPKNRRKFLDILISQISKKYVVVLSEYKKTINLKNNLLKLNRNQIDINYLKILNEKLAKQIVEIVHKRKEFTELLWINAKEIQKNISKGNESLNFVYQTEFKDMDFEKVLKTLNDCIDNDILKKSSTKGIGHDDIIIYVNDTEVAKYGSQGQNRTALLSMKIGEFELLKTQKENVPLILLDDVFSELDNERINFLLDYIKKYQVFITTTTVENIKMDNVKFFDIEKIRTCEKK